MKLKHQIRAAKDLKRDLLGHLPDSHPAVRPIAERIKALQAKADKRRQEQAQARKKKR